MVTEWRFKKLDNYPSYIACSDGTFYSTARKKCVKMSLKPSRDKYLRLRVRNNKEEVYLWVQRLIAHYFPYNHDGNIDGKEVHHNDNNRQNNNWDNLRAVTKRINLDIRNERNGWKQA